MEILDIQTKSPQKLELTEPKVAVFMPALNEEKFIARNLEAISKGIEQGLIHTFVLVLDGCTDRTPEIVSTHFNLSSKEQLTDGTSKKVKLTIDKADVFLISLKSRPLSLFI